MDDGRSKIQPSKGSILVAEQEAVSRLSLSELLRNEGYHVIEAADSRTAIEQINRQQDVEIILADLEMPSWASLIKHARSTLPNSFILGMFRFGAQANSRDAQEKGAHVCLTKPLSYNEVSQWIQSHLTGQSEIKR